MTPSELHAFAEEFENGKKGGPLYLAFRSAVIRWLNQRVEEQVEAKIKGYAELERRAEGLQRGYDQLEAQLIALRNTRA